MNSNLGVNRKSAPMGLKSGRHRKQWENGLEHLPRLRCYPSSPVNWFSLGGSSQWRKESWVSKKRIHEWCLRGSSLVFPLDLSGRLTNLDGVLKVISEGRELWYWSIRMYIHWDWLCQLILTWMGTDSSTEYLRMFWEISKPGFGMSCLIRVNVIVKLISSV